MKKYFVLYTTIFFYINCKASIVINIGINCDSTECILLQNSKAYISSYSNTDFVLIDSTNFKENTFSFITDNDKPYACQIKLPSIEKPIQLIISPKENKILMLGDYTDFINGNYTILFSEENKSYTEFLKIEDSFNKSKFSETLITEYNKSLKLLSSKYPNSLTDSFIISNKIIPNIQDKIEWISEYKDEKIFYSKHFLDNYKIDDDRILNFPFFFESLKRYRQLYGKDHEAKRWLENLFSTTISRKVKSVIFYYLLYNYTMENNNDGVESTYLLNKNIIIDSTSNDGKFTLALKKIQPGNLAPDIVLQDKNKNIQILSAFVKKHKLSVLFIYAHNCDHCLETAPILNDLVKQYNSTNIGIFAVDIEPDLVAWESFITKNNYNFTNVFLQPEHSLQLSLDYIIFGTPILVLIDEKGKIITRFGTINKIKEILSAK